VFLVLIESNNKGLQQKSWMDSLDTDESYNLIPECKLQKTIFFRLDQYILHRDIEKSHAEANIRNLTCELIWPEAARLPAGQDFDYRDVFFAKQLVNKLATPHNIQSPNNEHFPNIFHKCLTPPHYAHRLRKKDNNSTNCSCCPLHPNDKQLANEYHIFCKCPTLSNTRTTLILKAHTEIGKELNKYKVNISYNLWSQLLCPAKEINYTYGRPPLKLKHWLINLHSDSIPSVIMPRIQKRCYNIFRDFYHDLWVEYCSTLNKKNSNFSSMLLKNYGIKPADMKTKKRCCQTNTATVGPLT
jgi:hypothetical protein